MTLPSHLDHILMQSAGEEETLVSVLICPTVSFSSSLFVCRESNALLRYVVSLGNIICLNFKKNILAVHLKSGC